MSAPTDNDQTYEQPNFEKSECGCTHQTVTITQLRWVMSVALVLAIVALATAIGAIVKAQDTRTVYYTRVEQQAPDTIPYPEEPSDSTTAKERKEFGKFLAQGKVDVLKWSTSRNFDKSAGANVALSYLCMAKSSKAGRYYAASKIDDDQDWGMEDGERLGNPHTTAREWCASTPSWAKPKEGEVPPKPRPTVPPVLDGSDPRP